MNSYRLLAFAVSIGLAACADSGGSDRPVTVDHGGTHAANPLASYQEAGLAAPGCHVTLNWCVSPTTGGSTCTATNCTIERALSACLSLIDSTCGF